MLGYEEDEDTDSHLSSSRRQSGDASARKEEGSLCDATYATPHRNQVLATFQRFFYTLTLTHRKVCRVH